MSDQLAKQEDRRSIVVIEKGLDAKIETMRGLLPKQYKKDAGRFIKRALMYAFQNESIQECNETSFVEAVLKAAELGLAIDGRLAYAVAYRNSKTDVKEAKLIVGYAGMVAVARRAGVIKSARSRVVCANDKFTYAERNGQQVFEWEPNFSDRGDPIGAFACLVLPDSMAVYHYMPLAEILKHKPSNKYANSPNSRWNTHPERMYEKTVLRDALKLYQDDPQMTELFDVEYQDSNLETSAIDRPPVNMPRSTEAIVLDEQALPMQAKAIDNQSKTTKPASPKSSAEEKANIIDKQNQGATANPNEPQGNAPATTAEKQIERTTAKMSNEQKREALFPDDEESSYVNDKF